MQNASTIATDRYLTFSLGSAVFALSIHCVREILDAPDITAIPQAPPCMPGIVNVRGAAVAVCDLGCQLGLDPVAHTPDTRIVIVERRHDGRLSLAGLLADAVLEVVEIEGASVQPPPRASAAMLRGIAGDGGRFLLLLDLDAVFRRGAFGDRAETARNTSEADESGPGGDAGRPTAD